MKILLIGAFVLASNSACAQVVNWANNPLNYKNSPYNFDNSQYDYRNSQYNWANSPYNFDSKSGIYNDQGERINYEVKNAQGSRNFFDTESNRIGYQQ